MDSFQEDIIEIRNLKSKYGLKEMNIYFHEYNINTSPPIINEFWSMPSLIQKLIRGVNVGYISIDEHREGLLPLITNNALYLIDLKNDGSDCLKQIQHYKQRVFQIKNKLNNVDFCQNAPSEIIALEQKKLSDFENRWERACIGYMYV